MIGTVIRLIPKNFQHLFFGHIVRVLRARRMVWWLPISATRLSKPINVPLTEPLHRRSIFPDVPVTVAAASSARFYPSSRAPELTQSPALLRQVLFRMHHRSISDLSERGSLW